MGIVNYIMLGMIAIVFGVVAYIIHDEELNTHVVCRKEAIVLDILKVHYRSATILTDKGEIVLNQATVKDGDTICLRSERVRNGELR